MSTYDYYSKELIVKTPNKSWVMESILESACSYIDSNQIKNKVGIIFLSEMEILYKNKADLFETILSPVVFL